VFRDAVWLLLMLSGVVGTAYASVTGTVGPITTLMLLCAGFVFGAITGLVVHESGHLLFDLAMSNPVRLLSIGTGPLLLNLRVGETTFELRMKVWNGGFVAPYPALVVRKYQTLLVLIGGLLGQGVLLVLLIWCKNAFALPVYIDLIVVGAVVSQALSIIGSLSPGGTPESDKRKFWQTLRGPRSGPTQAGKFFAAMLRAYGSGEAPSVSAAAPRLYYHLRRERWIDEQVRREVDAALQRELKRGGLTREEELLALDALTTDALLLADADLRPHLNKWSLRALSLAPNIKTVCGTRGGVLVELGRYPEARPFLEPLTSAQEPSLDRLLAHAFLARAEQALGNVEAAVHNVSQAREICDTVPQLPVVISFVQRAEAEVGVSAPTSGEEISTPKRARRE
jgi:hypothetical protein